MEHPTKLQKPIPDNIVLHIDRKDHSHLSTSTGKLITGDFFFDMNSCEYSTTPKGENKRTHILRKGDIKFYRKKYKIMHSRSHIHLEDKV